MRNVRAWLGLALVTVVVWGMGSSAFAEPNWQEFWSGELGALGGGFVGASLCLFGRTPCEALMHKVLDQNVFQLTKKTCIFLIQRLKKLPRFGIPKTADLFFDQRWKALR